MKENKVRYCSECKAGEIYDEPAVAKVRHPNEDTFRHAPPITKLVCDHHFSMLSTDYGEDLVCVDDRVNESALPSFDKLITKYSPREQRQLLIASGFSVQWNVKGELNPERTRAFATANAERAFNQYDKILEEIEIKGGWVKVRDHNQDDLVIASATIN